MATVQDMILDEVRSIREQINELFKTGCSKAANHDACNAELFKRVNQLEVSSASVVKKDKIDRLIECLNTWPPWIAVSVASFSPNFPSIVEAVKGWTSK